MVFKLVIERIYTALIVAIFLLIFSIVTIKFFIPKTIWMVNDFPYPTEYYTPKKIYSVLGATAFLFVMLFMYYKVVIMRLNKGITTMVGMGYIFIILASEVIVSSIAYHPIIGKCRCSNESTAYCFNYK